MGRESTFGLVAKVLKDAYFLLLCASPTFRWLNLVVSLVLLFYVGTCWHVIGHLPWWGIPGGLLAMVMLFASIISSVTNAVEEFEE
jgi:putative effector of murein hydrolase LrgA (UPF0299 family)